MSTEPSPTAEAAAAAQQTPAAPDEYYTIHEGKFFVWRDIAGFCGFVAAPARKHVLFEGVPYLWDEDCKGFFAKDGFVKDTKPYIEWRGGQIPISLWQTVLAFFQAHKSNEVQVRLYYNPVSKEWKAHAFPQEYPSGMTTKELPNHKNTAEDAAMFPEPWVRMGSVHHHCSMAAFQSGTDKTDEEGVVGLHITVGKLNDPKFDIHSRVCLRLPGTLDAEGKCTSGPQQVFYDADLSQWFCLPETWESMLPAAVLRIALNYMLSAPVAKEIGYPQRWEDNLIKYESKWVKPSWGSEDDWEFIPGVGYQRKLIPFVPSTGGTNGTGVRSGPPPPPRGAVGEWNLVNNDIISLICNLIETYHGDDGAFMVQVVDTTDWHSAGFHSLNGLEKLLQGIGFTKITSEVWCFPRDKDKVEKVMKDVDEAEAREELERSQGVFAHAGMHGGVD